MAAEYMIDPTGKRKRVQARSVGGARIRGGGSSNPQVQSAVQGATSNAEVQQKLRQAAIDRATAQSAEEAARQRAYNLKLNNATRPRGARGRFASQTEVSLGRGRPGAAVRTAPLQPPLQATSPEGRAALERVAGGAQATRDAQAARIAAQQTADRALSRAAVDTANRATPTRAPTTVRVVDGRIVAQPASVASRAAPAAAAPAAAAVSGAPGSATPPQGRLSRFVNRVTGRGGTPTPPTPPASRAGPVARGAAGVGTALSALLTADLASRGGRALGSGAVQAAFGGNERSDWLQRNLSPEGISRIMSGRTSPTGADILSPDLRAAVAARRNPALNAPEGGFSGAFQGAGQGFSEGGLVDTARTVPRVVGDFTQAATGYRLPSALDFVEDTARNALQLGAAPERLRPGISPAGGVVPANSPVRVPERAPPTAETEAETEAEGAPQSASIPAGVPAPGTGFIQNNQTGRITRINAPQRVNRQSADGGARPQRLNLPRNSATDAILIGGSRLARNQELQARNDADLTAGRALTPGQERAANVLNEERRLAIEAANAASTARGRDLDSIKTVLDVVESDDPRQSAALFNIGAAPGADPILQQNAEFAALGKLSRMTDGFSGFRTLKDRWDDWTSGRTPGKSLAGGLSGMTLDSQGRIFGPAEAGQSRGRYIGSLADMDPDMARFLSQRLTRTGRVQRQTGKFSRSRPGEIEAIASQFEPGQLRGLPLE